MKKIKGPGVFLAQFAQDTAPYNSLESVCRWAKGLGYEGIQIPSWDSRFIDLTLAAESEDYAQEIKGVVNNAGLEITELSTHIQGQLVATHPAYDKMFNIFAPTDLHNSTKDRTEWAQSQMLAAAQASARLGLQAHATFSGAFLWHTVYPWPQRPAGIVEEAFKELAKRWTPILNAFDEAGVDVCYELHPGEDLHDGVTFERFLEATGNHARANILYDPSHFMLQQLDYLAFIDIYHERIKAMHVKDAEFRPNGKSGVYGGYQSWADRPGRFRSLGDGQIDFKHIFSQLTKYDFDGWAVLEWECCIKDSEDGAREGAAFIKDHLIQPPSKSFDDFAGSETSTTENRLLLGLEN